eukprot:SAG31_NODE_41728_length_274_cov_1.782857_1_plen_31_part_01
MLDSASQHVYGAMLQRTRDKENRSDDFKIAA